MIYKEAAQVIKKFNNIALIAHVRPDGDTVSCCAALALALSQLNKTYTLYCGDAVSQRYSFITADKFETAYKYKHDLYIALDCADLARLGPFKEPFEGGKAETLNIDHHPSNANYAKYNYRDSDAPATAVIVYEIIKSLQIKITPEIASTILTGISSDTGNFAHRNTDEKTFLLAAELIKKGADINLISNNLFKSNTFERQKLLGRALSNMRLYAEGRIAVIYTLLTDLAYCKAEPDTTEGFIDHALSVNGVEIAICVLQHNENTFKVSFRSKGGADVNKLASFFGGGGHTLASGCNVSGFFEDALDKLVRTAESYL